MHSRLKHRIKKTEASVSIILRDKKRTPLPPNPKIDNSLQVDHQATAVATKAKAITTIKASEAEAADQNHDKQEREARAEKKLGGMAITKENIAREILTWGDKETITGKYVRKERIEEMRIESTRSKKTEEFKTKKISTIVKGRRSKDLNKQGKRMIAMIAMRNASMKGDKPKMIEDQRMIEEKASMSEDQSKTTGTVRRTEDRSKRTEEISRMTEET